MSIDLKNCLQKDHNFLPKKTIIYLLSFHVSFNFMKALIQLQAQSQSHLKC